VGAAIDAFAQPVTNVLSAITSEMAGLSRQAVSLGRAAATRLESR